MDDGKRISIGKRIRRRVAIPTLINLAPTVPDSRTCLEDGDRRADQAREDKHKKSPLRRRRLDI